MRTIILSALAASLWAASLGGASAASPNTGGGTICGPSCYPKTDTRPWPPRPVRPIKRTGRLNCGSGWYASGGQCYPRLH
ncbi:hypothetical protein QA634_23550 [Methylobacterium sp. CB376]|uniref:hypothetical protein n=1 Tax=unclassified Methylobacterium TaxID=2615210 RepID=UPI0005BACE71|nr:MULTISPECIES: hypothetical protein [Methylobacterium]WFT78238.1 hypothetical protein QA634_23550 [Methylobacterium nodulans]